MILWPAQIRFDQLTTLEHFKHPEYNVCWACMSITEEIASRKRLLTIFPQCRFPCKARNGRANGTFLLQEPNGPGLHIISGIFRGRLGAGSGLKQFHNNSVPLEIFTLTLAGDLQFVL